MEKAGYKVDRHQVSISQAIKTVGLFTIPVVLHPEVKVNVTVNVARSEDEAERQARGEDVLAGKTEAEEARAAAEAVFEEGAGPAAGRNRRGRSVILAQCSLQKPPTRKLWAGSGVFHFGRDRARPDFTAFPRSPVSRMDATPRAWWPRRGSHKAGRTRW